MKTIKMLSVILFCLLVWNVEGQAQTNEWIGTWQYDAPQAQPPYQQGNLIFEEEGDTLAAFVGLGENRMPVQQLEISEDQASFSVTIEGQLIRVSLNKEDEKLSGEALYSGGKTDITAEKAM